MKDMRRERGKIAALLLVILVGTLILAWGLFTLSHAQPDPIIQSGVVLPDHPHSGTPQSGETTGTPQAPQSDPLVPDPPLAEPSPPPPSGPQPVSPAPPVLVDDDLDDVDDD